MQALKKKKYKNWFKGLFFFQSFFFLLFVFFSLFFIKTGGNGPMNWLHFGKINLFMEKKQNSVILLHIGWYINWQKKKEKTTWIRRENSDLWVGWWYRHIHLSSLYLWYWCFSHLPIKTMNSFKETRKQIPVAIERQNFSLFHSP